MSSRLTQSQSNNNINRTLFLYWLSHYNCQRRTIWPPFASAWYCPFLKLALKPVKQSQIKEVLSGVSNMKGAFRFWLTYQIKTVISHKVYKPMHFLKHVMKTVQRLDNKTWMFLSPLVLAPSWPKANLLLQTSVITCLWRLPRFHPTYKVTPNEFLLAFTRWLNQSPTNAWSQVNWRHGYRIVSGRRHSVNRKALRAPPSYSPRTAFIDLVVRLYRTLVSI